MSIGSRLLRKTFNKFSGLSGRDEVLTSLFFRCNEAWLRFICILPHQLTDLAVHAIAAYNDIALLNRAICQLDLNSIEAFFYVYDFGIEAHV